jgi:hypothetical protein
LPFGIIPYLFCNRLASKPNITLDRLLLQIASHAKPEAGVHSECTS